MSELVLVTGGDGFLGTHLVAGLHEQGYDVRVFCEPGRPDPALNGRPVEIVHGDIRKPDDVSRAAEGCDYLIHAAASTSIWPSRSMLLEEINVVGTRNIIEAALTHGVKRLVHVGTASSFGPGSLEDPGTEDRPFAGERYRLGYIETKRRAQLMVAEAVTERGLPAVIVAPTFMIGPNDSKPGSGQMIIAIVERQLPGFSGGGRNYVYVKDVAVGIVSALTRGTIGESYILGHENLTYREFFRKVGAVAGVTPPKIRFPGLVVKVTGFLGSLMGTLTRKTPRVTLPMARISVDWNFYTADKAVRELGMPQTPIETAIREAIEWFREHGYLSS